MTPAVVSSSAPRIAQGVSSAPTRVENLHVIRVAGTAYEMGFQHGAQLRQEVAEGPIPYFRTYLTRMMGSAQFGPLAPVVWSLLQRGLGRRVQKSMPQWSLDAIRGVADGAGIPMQDLLDGCTLPDALVHTMSQLMRVRGIPPAVKHRLDLGLGCTTAVAGGSATRGGALLHARNFDYFGVESWPKTATVAFHNPSDGGRYVSIAAAGIPLGGITAMNEAGLTLTVHQHIFSDQSRLGGVPVGIVGDEVMRHAKNLDDAERILGSYRPIGCWTYVITDAHRKEILCWEESPNRNVAKRYDASETFAYTNIYYDEVLGATERETYGSYWRQNKGRLVRARHNLAEAKGSIDERTMMALLADTGDDDCRLHRATAMLMTVASVVFRPEDGIVWVATGGAPTSHGEFVPFSLAEEGVSTTESRHRVEALDERQQRAFEAYRRAYLAYVDEGDVAGASVLMSEASTHAPDQSLYLFLSAMLALKSHSATRAAELIESALSLGHPDIERVSSFHLWRGRALDVAGRRHEAQREYRLALARPSDQAVRDASLRGLKRAYKASKISSIDIDFTFGDVAAP